MDIDGDSDFDLFIGYSNGFDPSPKGIAFYSNIGNSVNAVYSLVTMNWGNIELDTYSTSSYLCDIDNDGDDDIFIGSANGGLFFYRNLLYNNAVENPAFDLSPLTFDLLPCFPNPFNSSTTITFSIPTSSPVEIAVFDNLGRKVATLIDGMQPAGLNKVEWYGEGLSSGVYFISMEGFTIKQTQKVILLK